MDSNDRAFDLVRANATLTDFFVKINTIDESISLEFQDLKQGTSNFLNTEIINKKNQQSIYNHLISPSNIILKYNQVLKSIFAQYSNI